VRIVIRKAKPRDIDAVAGIEQQVYQHPWKKSYFTGELDHNISFFYVARDEESRRVAGYIIFWVVEETMELHNIAVAPQYKKKGVGRQLMQFMVTTAKEKKVQEIFLEVRASNQRAIEVYEGFGFERIGARKDYYSEPKEDAAIYKLTVNLTQ